MSQRLVERRNGGRVPAVEILVATGRIFDKIVNADETHEIEQIIAEGEYYGMQTFDQSLLEHLRRGADRPPRGARRVDEPARPPADDRAVHDAAGVGAGRRRLVNSANKAAGAPSRQNARL